MVEISAKRKELVEDKSLTENEVILHVQRPSWKKWMGIILIVIALDSFLFIFTAGVGLFVLLFVALIASWLWKKAYEWVTKKVILASLKQLREDQATTSSQGQKRTIGTLANWILNALGLKLSKDRIYYLEGEVKDIDLTGFKGVFKERIFDLISACAGISFLFAIILNTLIGDPETSITVAMLLMIVSPALVFWLIPVIWTVQDAFIRSIDEKHIVMDLADGIRNGLLNRFLGIGGFLAAFGFLLDVGEEFWNSLPGEKLSTAGIIVANITILILLVLMVAGTAYLVAVIYLVRFHEDVVNDFRRKVAGIIPVGVTIVRHVNPEEKVLLEEQQILEKDRKWE